MISTDSSSITINLGSGIVTILIIVGLLALGWARGFRYMLSIAIFLTVAYLLTVSFGDFVVGVFNRVYSNTPKLIAFALGRDPGSVDALSPLVPENTISSLLFRIFLFIALVAVGYGYKFPWEGTALKPTDRVYVLRLLGAVLGLYSAVLMISAVASFWNAIAFAVNVPALLGTALGSLPTFDLAVRSLIAAFLVLLLVVTVLRFNRIWATDVVVKK